MFRIIEYVGGGLILVVIVVVLVLHNRTRNLNTKYFVRKWRKLQGLCSDKKRWRQAIIAADNLLDEALKKRHFRGKTTGERLVAAQRQFSANDSIWLSHKFTNKLRDDRRLKLSKKQTLDTLASFRSALKDLGAFGKEGKTK